jgi:HPt (histidine-containing phosphotransfer) domain-containing protein
MEEAAHRLSGAASNVGFDDLAAAAAFLQEVALIGPPTEVSQAADVTVMRFKEAGLVVKAFTLDL